MQQNKIFAWRRTELADTDAVTAIYNESVDGGGHSPVLRKGSAGGVEQMIRECRRNGWPAWVLLYGAELIAWAMVRPISWGPEVCQRTGDLSVYVRHDWHGRGAAMEVVRNVFRDVQRHGFDAISCWILGDNSKSQMVAHAFRMSLWGCLPRAACYGDREYDVLIYGVRFDDRDWYDFMAAREARRQRRANRRV
jgi:phosphinothricin acetyltransferase